jgi:hypothetical protein
MAQVVRTGWYKAVHLKSELSQGWRPEAVERALLSGHKLLVAKLRDLDNCIRGLLRGFGLKAGQISEAAFPTRVRELTAGHGNCVFSPRCCATGGRPRTAIRPALIRGCQRGRPRHGTDGAFFGRSDLRERQASS